jgi:DNA polymerase/3'-5' exonuclease PolX
MKILKLSSWEASTTPIFISKSSRRGSIESNEIDVLITHPTYQDLIFPPDLLQKVVDKLHSTGHITNHLMCLKHRYDGISKLPTPDNSLSTLHRRIKFRFVPWNSFVFAQLYYTGTHAFMIRVREQAAKRGYSFTLDGLQKRVRTAFEVFGVDGLKYMEENVSKDDKTKEGEWVHLESEEDIFRFLRMRYVSPQNRNWY